MIVSDDDVHNQYSAIIKHLIEKQISKDMPELEGESFTIEIQERYKKILHEHFGIPKPK